MQADQRLDDRVTALAVTDTVRVCLGLDEQTLLVEVAYDREDPKQAKIVSFWTVWFVPLVLALFGVACLFAGTHTVRQNKRS